MNNCTHPQDSRISAKPVIHGSCENGQVGSMVITEPCLEVIFHCCKLLEIAHTASTISYNEEKYHDRGLWASCSRECGSSALWMCTAHCPAP
jgi:hypothetical protein